MRFTFGRWKLVCLSLCLIGLQPLDAQTRRKVDVATAQVSNLKILRAGGAANIGAGTQSVEVTPSELLFEHLDRPVIVKQSASGVTRQELPFRLYGVSPNGSPLDLDVIVDVEGGGMRPSPNASSFVGTLRLGIVDTQDPNSQQTLPTPVNFQVTADVDSVAPEGSLSVDHTNLPFVPVTLSAMSPPDTVSVQIRPSFSLTNPVKVDVNVIRPELTVVASPKKIQGWGLEEADITISTRGITQPEGREVTLEATKGGLEKTLVTLDAKGVGATKIRSIGLGQAEITVVSSGLKGAGADVTFTPPWAFAISAIFGSLVGTLAGMALSKSKQSRPSILNPLARIALGILGAVAYAVGVNLTGYVPQAVVGEALTFFVAGIISYAGGLPKKGDA
jgi:hypothetical protein